MRQLWRPCYNVTTSTSHTRPSITLNLQVLMFTWGRDILSLSNFPQDNHQHQFFHKFTQPKRQQVFDKRRKFGLFRSILSHQCAYSCIFSINIKGLENWKVTIFVSSFLSCLASYFSFKTHVLTDPMFAICHIKNLIKSPNTLSTTHISLLSHMERLSQKRYKRVYQLHLLQTTFKIFKVLYSAFRLEVYPRCRWLGFFKQHAKTMNFWDIINSFTQKYFLLRNYSS